MNTKTQKYTAIAGADLPQECHKKLIELGFDVKLLPKYERLGHGVDTHADLMMFPIDKKIFTYKELTERQKDLFTAIAEKGYSIEVTDTQPTADYPNDIALNCLKVGKYIFCKKSCAANEIVKYAENNGYTVVNVNQGYARCAACPVGDNALITADPSIRKAAERVGLDVLAVSDGNIRLRGYDRGFIGGACGVFKNHLLFAGDLSAHPDGEKIIKFTKERGITVGSLSATPLTDIGSIFFI